MRYLLGIIIFMIFCYCVFFMYKRFAKEANREILREVRKSGYNSYREYIRDMQKKEYITIRKRRNREKWKKYQKKRDSSQ